MQITFDLDDSDSRNKVKQIIRLFEKEDPKDKPAERVYNFEIWWQEVQKRAKKSFELIYLIFTHTASTEKLTLDELTTRIGVGRKQLHAWKMVLGKVQKSLPFYKIFIDDETGKKFTQLTIQVRSQMLRENFRKKDEPCS